MMFNNVSFNQITLSGILGNEENKCSWFVSKDGSRLRGQQGFKGPTRPAASFLILSGTVVSTYRDPMHLVFCPVPWEFMVCLSILTLKLQILLMDRLMTEGRYCSCLGSRKIDE